MWKTGNSFYRRKRKKQKCDRERRKNLPEDEKQKLVHYGWEKKKKWEKSLIAIEEHIFILVFLCRNIQKADLKNG